MTWLDGKIDPSTNPSQARNVTWLDGKIDPAKMEMERGTSADKSPTERSSSVVKESSSKESKIFGGGGDRSGGGSHLQRTPSALSKDASAGTSGGRESRTV